MSVYGVVSRVTPVHTAVRNCTRDEGWPFGVAVKEEASNCHKLLRSKAAVVNVMVKGVALTTSSVDERDERKQTSADASKAD